MAKNSENPQISVEYEVDYRDIKYPRLEYKTGSLILILPKEYEDSKTILENHKEWITQKEQTIRQALEKAKENNIRTERTDKELKELVSSTTKAYREKYGFEVNGIYYKRMKTKWGSFSQRKNLTMNTLLKYLPEKLVNYVIFHELAHSVERRHDETFWTIVKKEHRNHQALEKDLLVYWFLVQEKAKKH